MMKERLQAVRTKIDQYARAAVAREVESQVKALTEDYLRPIAQNFLATTLEDYLKKHLNSSLEDVVSSLEDVFDAPEKAGVSYEDESPGVDVFGRAVTQEQDTTSFAESDETLLRNRLLAFLQVFQTEQNTEFAPRQKDIADGTGLKSMQIVRMYSDLRDEGRIEGPIRKGKHSVIRILKPLQDPQRYL